MASSKKRHYLSILKESEIIKKDMEENNSTKNNTDYDSICSMRDIAFVELLQTKMPYFVLAEQNVIRIAIDRKNYDMDIDKLHGFVGDDTFNTIMSVNDFKNIDDADAEDSEESEKLASQFESLKNQILSMTTSDLKDRLEIEDKKDEPNVTEEETNTKNEDAATSANNTEKKPSINQSDRQRHYDKSPIEEARHYRTKNGVTYAVNTTEIAFMGIEPGVGTTHSAIMCAQTLSEQYDVAYFEFNKTGHMMDLEAWMVGDEQLLGHFALGDIDFYYNMDYLDFISTYRDQYDFVIINFGNYRDNDNMTEYIRASKKFVVSSGIDWHLPKLEQFYNDCEYDRTHSIMYLVPFANTDTIKTAKAIVAGNTVFGIPFNENPLTPNESTTHIFKELFNMEADDVQEKSNPFQMLKNKFNFRG